MAKTKLPDLREEFNYKGWMCSIVYSDDLDRFIGYARRPGKKTLETAPYHHDFNAVIFLKAKVDAEEGRGARLAPDTRRPPDLAPDIKRPPNLAPKKGPTT